MLPGGARRLLSDVIARLGALTDKVTWLGEQQATASAGDEANVEAVEVQTAAIVDALHQIRDGVAQVHADAGSSVLTQYLDGLEGLISGTNTKIDALVSALGPKTPWSARADSGALILNSTAKLLKGAAGAGLRNYVTHIQLHNQNALTPATVEVLDDATVIWSWLLAGGGKETVPVALPGTANKALNVRLTGTITTGVLVQAQGYVAA